MNRSMQENDVDAQSPTEQETTEEQNRMLRLYGKLPSKADLLHHQLENRKYFDSGDFALSQAHTASNVGNVQTGTQHPLRKSISGPSAPVPGGSNVKESAKKQDKGSEDTYKARQASNLHRQTSADQGQDKQ